MDGTPSKMAVSRTKKAQRHRPRQPAPKRADSAQPTKPLFAALDLGTNSCRMLIARPKANTFEVVDAFSKSVFLGRGLDKNGVISRAAMGRAISALQVCAHKINQHKVRNMRLIATASCRQARNGRAFVDNVQKKTGLRLRIVMPEEEARLAVIGCAAHLRENADNVLVVDIGGGSTELIWLNLERIAKGQRRKALMQLRANLKSAVKSTAPKNIDIQDWISVPVGVTTLREKFLDVSGDKERFALMSWQFEEMISEFGPREGIGRDRLQIIATSGTVTTIASTLSGLRSYDRKTIDGMDLSSCQIEAEIARYLRLGPKGREDLPCIGRERMDLIMSGSAILQAILRVWPTNCLTVADRGLREGLLVSQMSKAGYLN